MYLLKSILQRAHFFYLAGYYDAIVFIVQVLVLEAIHKVSLLFCAFIYVCCVLFVGAIFALSRFIVCWNWLELKWNDFFSFFLHLFYSVMPYTA